MRLRDLKEANLPQMAKAGRVPSLQPDVKNTLSPTMIMPELINSDTYRQYRYTLALASARAYAAGEIDFDSESAWNESLAAVAYTPAEQETIEMANKMMNVKGVMLSDTASHEPDDINTVSPVMKFNMFESNTEAMRNLREYIEQIENNKE